VSHVAPAERAAQSANATGQAFRRLVGIGALAPWLLGIGLYIFNNLAILGGWLHAPAGYEPMFVARAGDLAQYLTWIEGFKLAPLIPNYLAPWQTEARFFALLPWTIAHLATLVGGRVLLAYHLLHLIGFVLASHTFLLAVRVFTNDRTQARAALFTMVLAMPLLSLAVLPVSILRAVGARGLPELPGIGDFVWWSSDGFFHGISGSLLVTFGTACALGAISTLGLYLRTHERRYLHYACLIAFVSALVHPFEVVVIVGAGATTLLLVHRNNMRRGLLEAGMLAASGAAGLLPVGVQVLTAPWLRDAASRNDWQPFNPLRMLTILGLPAILTLVLLIRQPRASTPTDGLLRNWYLFTLLALYVPGIPWPQHLLDGFHYVGALQLVRLAANHAWFTTMRWQHPRIATSIAATWLLLALSAYFAYGATSYADGARPEPEHTFTAVASTAEVRVIEWLRSSADADDLVLAPRQHAPWLATVPMHSFASHFIFSLTYSEQAQLSNAFFAGELSQGAAENLLAEYGVRYAVVPDGSPAVAYLDRQPPRARFGNLSVYALETSGMKPYPGLQGRE
jgi:hypothetical protein